MARRSTAKASRGRLSRERILSAALQIVDDEGLPGLTIRRLAGELDVTPMAVYRHFRNKAEIMDGLIEVVVAEGAAAEHSTEGWREWLIETFLRMRNSLIAHPGVMPLMGTSASYGVHSLRIAEQLLARLRASGMSDDTVARAMHVLVAYTLGAVAIEIAAREQRSEAEKVDNTEWQRQMRVRFESASIAEFPNLVTLAPKLAEFVQTERFVHGLDRIIDGFVANPADD